MPVATVAPAADLTRADRCDRCSAQAFVRAVLPSADGLELLFCGHHFRDHELKLIAAGAVVHDQRHRIDEAARTPES